MLMNTDCLFNEADTSATVIIRLLLDEFVSGEMKESSKSSVKIKHRARTINCFVS